MKGQLFFNSFRIKNQKYIILFAGDSKLGLVHTLARESVNAGYTSLVISFAPMPYPIEGEVIISDSVEVTLSSIGDKRPANYYLAGNVNGDLLNPLSLEQLGILSENLPAKTKLFIHANSSAKSMNKELEIFSKKMIICEVNYNAIRNSLDTFAKKDKVDADHPFEEKIHKQVLNLISKNCPLFKSQKKTSEKICYMGQIKNLYDENSIIPIARQMKTSYSCRVLVGYIQNYSLKEV